VDDVIRVAAQEESNAQMDNVYALTLATTLLVELLSILAVEFGIVDV